jgi:hypothetical protein
MRRGTFLLVCLLLGCHDKAPPGEPDDPAPKPRARAVSVPVDSTSQGSQLPAALIDALLEVATGKANDEQSRLVQTSIAWDLYDASAAVGAVQGNAGAAIVVEMLDEVRDEIEGGKVPTAKQMTALGESVRLAAHGLRPCVGKGAPEDKTAQVKRKAVMSELPPSATRRQRSFYAPFIERSRQLDGFVILECGGTATRLAFAKDGESKRWVPISL